MTCQNYYSTNSQISLSRKRSIIRANFILHFRFIFSRGIPSYPIVPSPPWATLYIVCPWNQGCGRLSIESRMNSSWWAEEIRLSIKPRGICVLLSTCIRVKHAPVHTKYQKKFRRAIIRKDRLYRKTGVHRNERKTVCCAWKRLSFGIPDSFGLTIVSTTHCWSISLYAP